MQNRQLLQLAALVLAAAGVSAASAQLQFAAFDRLKSGHLFAFGGVGFAGQIMPAQHDFDTLVGQPPATAVAQLEELYAEGTPEARAFALAGLHRIAPDRFNALTVKLPSDTVHTAQGCVMDDASFADVVADIRSGRFDSFIKPSHLLR